VARLGWSATLLLALAACVAAEPEENACGAAGMQDLIGKDHSVLAAMTFPAGTRIITPGMAVTEDYSPSRLNIDLDGSGKITGVWCG
jgi:hypothetical protein